ncbi:phosphotransferase [Jannaschia sp. Os4]|uniref:aminoglycoside phosphotransferase family protein n=1 Tax=Jannaschia sp. Os4 TaxID=2807617 RepID=UPI001939BC96|nr:phosphotransferase [Jannaschia sp. Os4]MBM2575830.1 phosphotransferase [Jannaschia sp. Os4]
MSRADAIDAFLAEAGWGGARRHRMTGDASLRRYERLERAGARAILMDAPPATGEDVRPFVRLARHLSGAGLSAPAIMAADEAAGLLLLEDLGDDLLAAASAADPGAELDLYAAAARTLAAMQAAPRPDGLAPYAAAMPDLAATVVDWYAPELRDRRDAVEAAMAAALDAMPPGPEVMVHRDYHAENLLWLPKREGPARIGLLDFQDAMTGPAEYDLASLIHDPRRAVSPAAQEAAVVAWRDRTGAGAAPTAHRIAVTSAQRSLRILGRVFTRLCLNAGRDGYLRFIPPTWEHLQRELRHPALAGVAAALDGLPAPTEARLAAIRAHAGRFAGADRAEAYA